MIINESTGGAAARIALAGFRARNRPGSAGPAGQSTLSRGQLTRNHNTVYSEEAQMDSAKSEIKNLRDAYQFVAEMIDDIRAALADARADLDRIEKALGLAAKNDQA